MASKSQLEANKRYIQSQDNVTIRMPKGKKSLLAAHAESQGESLNKFINRAIDETVERDQLKLSKGEE